MLILRFSLTLALLMLILRFTLALALTLALSPSLLMLILCHSRSVALSLYHADSQILSHSHLALFVAQVTARPIQYFENTVRFHLEQLTIEAEKPDYDEPIVLKRGQERPPKPRVGVSLLPALNQQSLSRDAVSHLEPLTEEQAIADDEFALSSALSSTELEKLQARQSKIDELTETAKKAEKSNSLVTKCHSLHKLAELYKEEGQMKAAAECVEEEYRAATIAGVPQLQANALLNKAKLVFEQRKFTKAAHRAEEALGKALVTDAQVLQWEVYLFLSKVYHQLAVSEDKPLLSKEKIEKEYMKRARATLCTSPSILPPKVVAKVTLSLSPSHSLSEHLPFNLTLTQSHTQAHSLSLVLVVMMKSKELKTKISHAHSLILSLSKLLQRLSLSGLGKSIPI